jgi:hypothetical protein
MLEAVSEGGEEGGSKDKDLEMRVPTDPAYPSKGVLDVFEGGG